GGDRDLVRAIGAEGQPQVGVGAVRERLDEHEDTQVLHTVDRLDGAAGGLGLRAGRGVAGVVGRPEPLAGGASSSAECSSSEKPRVVSPAGTGSTATKLIIRSRGWSR